MFQKEIENAVVLVGDEMKKSDNAWLSLRKKRQRIDLKTDGHILFLDKGTVSVYRVENDLVTVSISAPAILGHKCVRKWPATIYVVIPIVKCGR